MTTWASQHTSALVNSKKIKKPGREMYNVCVYPILALCGAITQPVHIGHFFSQLTINTN